MRAPARFRRPATRGGRPRLGVARRFGVRPGGRAARRGGATCGRTAGARGADIARGVRLDGHRHSRRRRARHGALRRGRGRRACRCGRR
ncbi:MAG: hypothetical protein MZV63_40215 [Marinilabiliales bacterium]|nr:hypothetical protein [Marinilabiliales bacterium]